MRVCVCMCDFLHLLNQYVILSLYAHAVFMFCVFISTSYVSAKRYEVVDMSFVCNEAFTYLEKCNYFVLS